MIDKTKWAIVQVGPLTASGEDEILLRTMTKKAALDVLRHQSWRHLKCRHGYEVKKVS